MEEESRAPSEYPKEAEEELGEPTEQEIPAPPFSTQKNELIFYYHPSILKIFGKIAK